MKKIICDTDIIIEFYKNNKEIISELKKISQENIATSVITAGELLYGALNKVELKQLKKDIESLKVLHINNDICDKFIDLMQSYSLSHKVAIPDMFIAATAINYDIELFTMNIKDYRFIKGLKLYTF